ncbi:MAG: hypothetical protein J0I20_33895 [Chloroflexi bacterium]|nr:hypothetical protein [Chloroflexota bacterium]OJW05611.1 MAG: hypothetical protein BGO39_03060 [Chloroflexi bacterium 54-19]
MQQKFKWQVVNPETGEILAGANDRETANFIATKLEGKVEEAIIASINGELSFSKTNFYFLSDESETLPEAIASALGVKFPSGRNTGQSIELGYVNITIRNTVDDRELNDH